MSNRMKSRLASRTVLLIAALLLMVQGVVFAQVPARPKPERLVNDLAGIFTPREAATLEYRVAVFADTTSHQIAVVTVPELYGYDKAMLAYQIGQEWGIGQKKFDNGLVILVKPKTRTSNGEVFIATGYGLEGAVTDAFARSVIENEIIPYFRQNDYYGGVNAALNVLMPVISGEISTDEYAASQDDGALPAFIFMIFLGIFIFILAISSKGNNQNMGGGNNRGGRDFTATDAFILGSILGNATGSRHRGGFGGGSFGGGSFGGGGFGGFGGFGGGSFGGGGAGGSW